MVGHDLELGVEVEEEVHEAADREYQRMGPAWTHAKAAVECPDIQLSSESLISF